MNSHEMQFYFLFTFVNIFTNEFNFFNINALLNKMKGYTMKAKAKMNSSDVICIFTNRSDYYVTSTT